MKTRTAPSCASIHPFWMPAALAAMLAGLSFAAGEKRLFHGLRKFQRHFLMFVEGRSKTFSLKYS